MTEKNQITKNINAPSEKVWAAISGIGGLDKWTVRRAGVTHPREKLRNVFGGSS